MRHNEFGQPIGDAVPGFTPGERPGRPVLQGRFCRLERLSAAQHGDDLYAFHGPGANLADWTYVPREPVPDRQTLQAQLERLEAEGQAWDHLESQPWRLQEGRGDGLLHPADRP